jgi:opacity protein-like surface antigen
MKHALSILLLILSVSSLNAQTTESAEKTKSVPVKHWEFDYFNYGVSAGQGTAYLNFSMALRYNFDTPLVDVGGEFTMGATPHDRYDPLELKKGTTLKRTYFMLSPVAHYNFRRGKNVSFYVGMGLGFGLATKQVFEGCTVELRIPTDGEVTVGPTISITFGGRKNNS